MNLKQQVQWGVDRITKSTFTIEDLFLMLPSDIQGNGNLDSFVIDDYCS